MKISILVKNCNTAIHHGVQQPRPARASSTPKVIYSRIIERLENFEDSDSGVMNLRLAGRERFGHALSRLLAFHTREHSSGRSHELERRVTAGSSGHDAIRSSTFQLEIV